MLIARMCIEAADLRIRLDGSRGLSPCQLIIAPRYRLHQKVTLVQAAFFRGKFNSGGRGVQAAACALQLRKSVVFRDVKKKKKGATLFSYLLFSSYENNTWADLFFLVIIPPREMTLRPLAA